jgi:aspartate-semialdehyde dehydrogenase
MQDTAQAFDIEPVFRDAGIPVFSNASAFRMAEDVPLVVPQVNGAHLSLATRQPSFSRGGGFIVTNANCSTTGLVIALKPLCDAFRVRAVTVTTLQAVSGAGYPGVPSLDILDNVIPHIGGEEDKLETEYAKILAARGGGEGGALTPPAFAVSAAVHRVLVRDGHSLAVCVDLESRTPGAPPPGPEEVRAALAAWRPDARVAALPSAPSLGFIQLRAEPNRPQPRLDRDAGGGFTTVIGRVRKDPVHTVKMSVLSHNTVMGAAGSSVLNAELAAVMGLLQLKK